LLMYSSVPASQLPRIATSSVRAVSRTMRDALRQARGLPSLQRGHARKTDHPEGDLR
jgi:hypothetical protein